MLKNYSYLRCFSNVLVGTKIALRILGDFLTSIKLALGKGWPLNLAKKCVVFHIILKTLHTKNTGVEHI